MRQPNPVSRPSRARRGQSLLEFAIAVPVLVALFSGILDLGRVYYFQISARDAARDGARVLIGNYGGGSPSASTVCAAIENDLKDVSSVGCSEVGHAGPYVAGTDYTLPGANQAVALVYCGAFTAPATSACSTSTGGGTHDTVQVSVYYGFSPLTPLIASFAGTGGLIQLSSSARMVSNW